MKTGVRGYVTYLQYYLDHFYYNITTLQNQTSTSDLPQQLFIHLFVYLFILDYYIYGLSYLSETLFFLQNYMKIIIYSDFTIKKLHEKYYSPFLFSFSNFHFHSFIKISFLDVIGQLTSANRKLHQPAKMETHAA